MKFFLVFSFLLSSVLGGFVYDEGNDQYFYNTNNADPNLTVKMLSFDNDFTLDNITLTDTVTGDVYTFQINRNFEKNTLKTYTFSLNDFENFTLSDFASGSGFEINMFFSSLEELSFSPAASPRDFTLYYDPNLPLLENSIPILVPVSKYGVLDFSELLSELIIRDSNGVVIYSKIISDSSNLNSYFDSQTILFSEDFIGAKTFTVEFADLAGNRVSKDVDFNFEDGPLTIDLKTNQDTPSLNYYFSSEAPELFGRTIYTSKTDSITLTLETSKKSVCYFSKPSSVADISVLTFEDLTDAKLNPQQLNSENELTHTISIPLTSSETFFWAGCVNKYDSSDSRFLSQELGLGKQLLSIKTLSGSFNMDVLYPQTLSTTNQFTVDVETTLPAECSATFDSQNFILDGDETLMKLSKSVELSTKKYNSNIVCYDQLHNKKEKSWILDVDPDKGIQITLSDNLYYFGNVIYSESSSIDIPFTTSSITSSCKYSEDHSIDPSNFDDYSNLTSISEGSIKHQFSISGLQKGVEKNMYIYCYDISNVFPSTKQFKVVYDDSKPILSDLYFLTSVGQNKKYIDSQRSIEVEFNVSSTLPISNYTVWLTGKNGSSDEKIYTADESETNFIQGLTYKKNNEDYSSISIIATNIFGKISSELKASYLLDVTSPTVTFQTFGEGWKIVCVDSETDCYKAFYGVSQSKETCVTSFSYDLKNKNETIYSDEHAYICARGLNGVGLSSNTVTQSTGFIPSENSFSDLPFEDLPFELEDTGSVDNETTIEEDQQEKQQEDVEPIEPFTPEKGNNSSSSTPLILGALLFIVASLGGGGYYAYRKGYLNDQLRKLGIKVPQSQTGSSNAFYTQEKGGNVKTGTTGTSGTIKKGTKKSNYDHHLSKLNKFLDSTLEKKSSLFDSFSGSQKGRVENYKDSMTNTKTKEKSAEDNFYNASSKTNLGSVKEQGEDFEDFHKKKKEAKALKDKDSKTDKK